MAVVAAGEKAVQLELLGAMPPSEEAAVVEQTAPRSASRQEELLSSAAPAALAVRTPPQEQRGLFQAEEVVVERMRFRVPEAMAEWSLLRGPPAEDIPLLN